MGATVCISWIKYVTQQSKVTTYWECLKQKVSLERWSDTNNLAFSARANSLSSSNWTTPPICRSSSKTYKQGRKKDQGHDMMTLSKITNRLQTWTYRERERERERELTCCLSVCLESSSGQHRNSRTWKDRKSKDGDEWYPRLAVLMNTSCLASVTLQ